MDPNNTQTPSPGAPQPVSGAPYGSYGPQPAVAASQQIQPGVPIMAYNQPGQSPQQFAMGQPQPPPQTNGPFVAGQAPVPKPPPPKTNINSTQNTLQIAEIRDGIVIMNDGSFRTVVMVKSVNFDLMSPDEKEAVEFAYQGFLNSLYFPVQIFIRTQKVDIRPYLQRLDKIRSEHDNMLLALLMEDYLVYIDDLAMQTNIMDKKFYVVIPYFPIVDIQKAITQSKNFFTGLVAMLDTKEKHVVVNEMDLNKAKDELRNRVQAVLGGLQQAGIKGLPLDTQELIELYYDTYNPDTATRQPLKNFNDLTAPIITKGEGMASQPDLNRELP